MPAFRALLATPIVLTLLGPGARWAPTEGQRVEWRWTIENELELEEMSFGTDHSDTFRGILDGIELEVSDRLELVARDRLVERDSQSTLRLERELARARRTTRAELTGLGGYSGDGPDEIETVSRLEGVRLDFVWDERRKEPLADFAEDQDGDPELLDDLQEELDLRGLLGGRERRPGDAWYPDEDALIHLLRPGGDLAFVAPEADFVGEHEVGALGWLVGAAYVAGDLEAWGRAEYERVVTDDGRSLACIRLRLGFEVEKGDVRDHLTELVDTLGSGETWLGFAKEILVEVELGLEGLLYWDLDADRADSLELRGRSEARLELLLDLQPYYGMQWTLVAELRGTTGVQIEAAPID